jgi:DNA-directed RNA polymerase subunit RPC12/RpoP
MGERREQPRRARLPNELQGEQRSLEALRAHQLSDDPGREAPGLVGRPTQGVLVQVCLECGKEYLFDEHDPPPGMVCEKCGNPVFRSFFTPAEYDEVEADFRASTERDVAVNDPEADVTEVDVLDLNNP